jgi:peptidoglycan/LPS O-acetylase OafA/YrhL
MPGIKASASLPGRFHSLDVLRGLAALAVIHTHWFVFFAGAQGDEAPDAERYPFYRVLEPLYTQGWRAVDLFFCLSGFIFWWLYAERIAARKMGARSFALLRFSRLYPLHLATLLFVAAAQWFFHSTYGYFLAVPINDAYHFVVNLFLVSGLGFFERGSSFNGPAWTISVEVFCYVVFYVVCALGLRRWWQIGCLVLLGFALEFTRWTAIGRGLLGFFTGVLAFMAFNALRAHGFRLKPIVLIGGIVGSWLLAVLNLHHNLLLLAAVRLFGSNPTIAGYDLAYVLSHHAFNWLPFQILPFPCTVIALAMLESYRGTLGRRLSFLGDISYSSYLLHFPVQLALVLAGLSLGWQRTIAYSPSAYLCFFATLILVSLVSYHYFERPAQRYLRKRLSAEC